MLQLCKIEDTNYVEEDTNDSHKKHKHTFHKNLWAGEHHYATQSSSGESKWGVLKYVHVTENVRKVTHARLKIVTNNPTSSDQLVS